MQMPRDVGQVLRAGLSQDPDKVAVVARSGTLTYGQLDGLANAAARGFEELGVRPGDRLAVSLPSDREILVAFHGAMRLGAIWVGINQALAAPEKAYILRDSRASLMLCDPATAVEVRAAQDTLPDLKKVFVIGAKDQAGEDDGWAELIHRQDYGPLADKVDPNAPAAIAYTSGTTGYPKGAVHSQTNLLLPGAYITATRRYSADLRKGDCFPLTILNMLVLTTLLTSQAAGTAIIMDTLSARGVADWIRDERVTVWNGPPPLLYTLAHDDTILPSDLESLNEVWSGGADCPEPIRRAFQTKFSAQICGTYGLTEAPTIVAIEPLGSPHVSRSSGRPLPHLEVTIQDPDGIALPAGSVGEICVGVRDTSQIAGRLADDWGVASDGDLAPYRTMLSYWGKPEQTDELLRGGVVHTGDAGSLDNDGNLIVSDRLNLMLNRGGANVYPAEVERVVLDFSSVDSCGVVGLPDERLGQRVGMLVQFKPGAEQDIDGLVAHCREELAQYKVPEFVAAVDELPRNAMGKLDRRKLAEVGQELLSGTARVP